MSTNVLDRDSVVLRLEFSIADAVNQRGLLPVIAAALVAWWRKPPRPGPIPAHLRGDLGLPPDDGYLVWPGHAPEKRDLRLLLLLALRQ